MPDAYENVREPSDQALQRFTDGEGYQPYAHRLFVRYRADSLYLALFARIGHAGAAEQTCASYGHDMRGGARVCQRCGEPDDPRSRR